MKNQNRYPESIFIREKPVNLLLSIKRGKKPFVAQLAKKTNCTYAHATNLLTQMCELGLVEFRKEGRTKYIELTEQGKKLAEHFEKITEKPALTRQPAPYYSGVI
ncbi:MAG: MarR family winged helix-turn-helix transcriptional regulator [archaeon]